MLCLCMLDINRLTKLRRQGEGTVPHVSSRSPTMSKNTILCSEVEQSSSHICVFVELHWFFRFYLANLFFPIVLHFVIFLATFYNPLSCECGLIRFPHQIYNVCVYKNVLNSSVINFCFIFSSFSLPLRLDGSVYS